MTSKAVAALTSAVFAGALSWVPAAQAQTSPAAITNWEGPYVGISLGRARGESRTLGTGSAASNTNTLTPLVAGGYCINTKNDNVIAGQSTQASCITSGSDKSPHAWIPTDTTIDPVSLVSGASSSSLANDQRDRGIFTLKAGQNWQDAAVVYGLEIDHTVMRNRGAALTTSSTGSVPEPQPVSLTTTAESRAGINRLVTLRGKLGTAQNESWLPYLTGGLALGRVTTASSATYTAQGVGGTPVTQYFGDTRWRAGYAVGAGVDYRIDQNLVLNIAYLYVNLGTHQANDSFSADGGSDKSVGGSAYSSLTASTRMLSVGLSYRY